MDWTVILCLLKFGLLYEAVQDLRLSNEDSDEFCKALQDGGVDSLPLRETLYTITRYM